LCDALGDANYRYGAVVIDARHFLPQSRARVFFVAAASDVDIPNGLLGERPNQDWHSTALTTAHSRLSSKAKSKWIWWRLPRPPVRNVRFADLIEERPTGCRWHTEAETERLLKMMTPLHIAKIENARTSGIRHVGGVYKRTRLDEFGVKRQRAEVRFDDTAGCLRTPGGGSSRQTILVIDGPSTRSRLLSPREAARLMGLDDSYKLPVRYNDAYHIAGDGVCVPVVRFLTAHLLEPLLDCSGADQDSMAA
jgi:DNA (cytosine-5)-methyltransferase 1